MRHGEGSIDGRALAMPSHGFGDAQLAAQGLAATPGGRHATFRGMRTRLDVPRYMAHRRIERPCSAAGMRVGYELLVWRVAQATRWRIRPRAPAQARTHRSTSRATVARSASSPAFGTPQLATCALSRARRPQSSSTPTCPATTRSRSLPSVCSRAESCSRSCCSSAPSHSLSRMQWIQLSNEQRGGVA